MKWVEQVKLMTDEKCILNVCR